MLTFSQRMGKKPVRTALQVDSLDRETRNALWNLVGPFFKCSQHSDYVTICKDIWTTFYHEASDTVPQIRTTWDNNPSDDELFYHFFRSKIIDEDWIECLNLIEFVVDDYYQDVWNRQLEALFCKCGPFVPSAAEFNAIFEHFKVGFRFVGRKLTRITNQNEIQSVEIAVKQSPPSVQELLSKAVGFLSDRKNPDYAKSVDCSISAVESQCRILLGTEKATLGEALSILEKKGVKLHKALKGAFEKLYGFTSDAGGIRHGGINPADVDQALAQFMLVSSSAFVNYLISKGIDNSNRK